MDSDHGKWQGEKWWDVLDRRGILISAWVVAWWLWFIFRDNLWEKLQYLLDLDWSWLQIKLNELHKKNKTLVHDMEKLEQKLIIISESIPNLESRLKEIEITDPIVRKIIEIAGTWIISATASWQIFYRLFNHLVDSSSQGGEIAWGAFLLSAPIAIISFIILVPSVHTLFMNVLPEDKKTEYLNLKSEYERLDYDWRKIIRKINWIEARLKSLGIEPQEYDYTREGK